MSEPGGKVARISLKKYFLWNALVLLYVGPCQSTKLKFLNFALRVEHALDGCRDSCEVAKSFVHPVSP
jgi:hypothetical protein